ncbi:MAG TPA: FecR domain-containing protein [Rhizomicrobium sp.]|nr:FecR domain-containing protein [Rhizomicrobium sp.]
MSVSDKAMPEGEREARAAATPAEGLRIEAAERILARRLSPDWNDENQRELDAWLENPANRIAYLRLDAAWERAGRLEAFRPLKRPVSAPAPQSRHPLILKFAAAAAAIAAVIGSSLYFAQPAMRTYATAVGERQTITLTDGSTIALNTNSVLKLSAKASARKAVLERGEALFQIHHDAQHPFVVVASGHRITDLGTKFIVREETDALKVTLLEGRARIETAGDAAKHRATDLTPGETVIASADALVKSKRAIATLANEASWQRGVLVFENATLADAARELNRYNVQKLVIEDPAVAKLKFDATIPTNGIQTFARVAQQVFGLKIERHEGEWIVSR